MSTTPLMSKEYITKLDYEFEGQPRIAYRIAGTRISFDSIVYAWRQGESPEGIIDSFSSLTLEQVHGALAFYLANQAMIDEYLLHSENDYDHLRQKSWEDMRQNRPELYEKLSAAKQALLTAA